jgi:hypothetical protein
MNPGRGLIAALRPDRSAAPSEASARVAVMTMTRDEADMLPRWLAYYGGQFGAENLFVVDDNSADGSTTDLPCSVFRMPPGPWKQNWMQTRTDLVNGLSRGLLACYDVVIFSDVDEFLVPDPATYDGLASYVDAHGDVEVIAPLAVNVLHNATVEPAFDPTRPVLAQRRFVKFVPGMCKPLIKRAAVPWLMGFHGIRSRFEIDPDLLLLHLKYYDNQALGPVAEARKHSYDTERRGAAASAWSLGSAESQRQLADWVGGADADDVPELDPRAIDVTKVVHRRDNGFFRSSGQSLVAMNNNPLFVLPERYRSVL